MRPMIHYLSEIVVRLNKKAETSGRKIIYIEHPEATRIRLFSSTPRLFSPTQAVTAALHLWP